MTHNLKKVSQKGFSIIELLIVVAIIAILLLIAVPQYQSYVARAEVSEGLNRASGAKLEAEVTAQSGDPLNTGRYGPLLSSTGEYTGAGTVTFTGNNQITIRFPMLGSASVTGNVDTVGTVNGNGTINWGCTSTSTEIAQVLPSSC